MIPKNSPTKTWHWINHQSVFYAHDQLIDEYGGGHGIRDQGLILSALHRPNQLVEYGDPDIADLAAAYVHGLIKNHGFMDGNKRTAYVVSKSFLELNGCYLTATSSDIFRVFTGVANNVVTQQQLATWFRNNIR